MQPGSDAKFRATVSERIAARSDLLWNRRATAPEWTQFLEEVTQGRPVTNLHSARPTAKLTNVGKPYRKA